jgi:hypothetical protein
MLAGVFGGNPVASAAYSSGLTLAPFRRIYGDLREVLLADSLFALPEAQADDMPQENDEAIVPEVIPMPSRARFAAAVARWHQDIQFDSLPDEMKEHESFQEITQDGITVVPLIAAHLRRSPSFLFLALEEILSEDPVPEDAYGNLQATVSAWLRWLQR